MLTRNPLVHRVYDLFTQLWFYLWSNTTDQCKRMCVLASLYARLSYCSEDDLKQLQELNRDFKLSRDHNALRFPILIAPWIWRNVLPVEKIDVKQYDSYAARLVKKMPCWLWYADAETRSRDIQRLLTYCVYRHGSVA